MRSDSPHLHSFFEFRERERSLVKADHLYPDVQCSDDSWLSLTCWLVGKFAISCSFMSLFVYASEVFPTPIRNVSVGLCSVLSRGGAIAAPYIRLLVCLCFSPFIESSYMCLFCLRVQFRRHRRCSSSPPSRFWPVWLPAFCRKPIGSLCQPVFARLLTISPISLQHDHIDPVFITLHAITGIPI